ncbi:PREDICTED: uncharacterized protein LOC109232625 [Nicotiana attenuata]|uniref:uncharacterized protein LOC109232625 n=1 Tax=Nicotiana attenuata TaxID=49451 RepID=UPI000904E6A9|nr:PREDICTED: uncharacterized protein LOC109232625 [Nicotiana attenuata]
MNKVLAEGSWFVIGHFISIWKWEPNFLLAESKLAITTIWMRLPQLSTEFYDRAFLEKMENRVGKLLKIDTCTSTTLRERYARICVQVLLDITVAIAVTIGMHNQPILYEREEILCKECGRISHTLQYCPFTSKANETNSPVNPNPITTNTVQSLAKTLCGKRSHSSEKKESIKEIAYKDRPEQRIP